VNEDFRDRLLRESKEGERASMAWMSYMKKYTEDQQKELYQEFLDAPIETMVLVKYKQIALDQIVSGILLAIETGKLADKQLEER
jgi:hypothetical protein